MLLGLFGENTNEAIPFSKYYTFSYDNFNQMKTITDRGKAMTKQDKDYLLTSMENILDKKLKPIMEVNEQQTLQLQKHEQSLYGAEGNNGLSGDMKSLKRSFGKFYVVSGVAQGVAVGVGVWIKSIIGK